MKKQQSALVSLAVMLFMIGTNLMAGISGLKNTSGNTDVTLWKYKTTGKIMATPLIDNGVLYIGSLDSSFYAIDAATGAKKWSYKTQNQIFGNAVIYQNIICFESGHVLYGLNLQGTLAWEFTMYTGTFLNMQDEWDYFHSSPCLVGNIAYIGSEKGLVYGIDVRDGSKVFQCQAPTAKYTVKTTPAIFDNKIYFGDWDGVFYVFDLTNSNLVWQYDTKKDNAYGGWINAIVTDPIILNGYVYFGGRSCNLYCLDAKTGSKKWMFHDSGDMWIVGGPTISGSMIFIGSSYSQNARAIDLNTGNLIWDAALNPNRVNSKPVIDGDNVYITSQHVDNPGLGAVYILDKNTGTRKTRVEMGTHIYSTPVLLNGLVYFGSENGFIYALKQNDLLNISYPDTYSSCPDQINLGKLNNQGTHIYNITVCNRGAVEDSVTIGFSGRSSLNAIKANVSAFKLAAHDSQSVSITIDPSSLSAGKTYSYNVTFKSLRALTIKSFSRTITFSVEEVTAIESSEQIPQEFSLEQNYPNPFNPTTIIEYQLPSAGYVTLKVYDLIGNEVAVLVNENQNGGKHRVELNTQAINGNFQLASGVYFYRLQAGDKVQTRKLLLMK